MPVVTKIEDLRVLAQKRVPRRFYDDVDSGCWTESSYRANSDDFRKIKLRQRVAVNVADRSARRRVAGPSRWISSFAGGIVPDSTIGWPRCCRWPLRARPNTAVDARHHRPCRAVKQRHGRMGQSQCDCEFGWITDVLVDHAISHAARLKPGIHRADPTQSFGLVPRDQRQSAGLLLGRLSSVRQKGVHRLL